MSAKEELRKLPSVDRLLALPELQGLEEAHGHELVVEAARSALEEARDAVRAGEDAPSTAGLAKRVAARLAWYVRPSLTGAINATGVVIHTNMGRAPLSERAREAMANIGTGYSNLEYELEEGRRGSRYVHAAALLCRLGGAEDALVVNNNASAVLLVLTALAKGKEVLISRSQLPEIGGGFRIPDVLMQSGAKLVEVGTTNRTYVEDYAREIDPENTALILRVHHSNFTITGFTHEPTLAELVELGREHGLPVVDDLGSGTLIDTARYGLAHEPTIQESISAGASIITASGDKLLGGPQAGIILGEAGKIAAIRKHPLTRAVRVDKTTLAALQATLLSYLEGKAEEEIPVWRMIAATPDALDARAARWRDALSGLAGVSVVDAESAVGGGSLPGQTLPTRALAIEFTAKTGSPAGLAALLRECSPPIVARIEDDRLLIDPRTVQEHEEDALLGGLREALGRLG